MPSRNTHQKITGTVGSIAIIPLLLLWGKWGACIAAGILVTLIPVFTPDLDINTRKFGGFGEFFGLKAYAQTIPHRYGLSKKNWQYPANILQVKLGPVVPMHSSFAVDQVSRYGSCRYAGAPGQAAEQESVRPCIAFTGVDGIGHRAGRRFVGIRKPVGNVAVDDPGFGPRCALFLNERPGYIPDQLIIHPSRLTAQKV